MIVPIIQVLKTRHIKTTNFKNPHHISSDPIRSVKSLHGAKRIVVNKVDGKFDLMLVEALGSIDRGSYWGPEIYYGGGIESAQQIEECLQCGVKKVISNTTWTMNGNELLTEMEDVGLPKETLVPSLDIGKSGELYSNGGTTPIMSVAANGLKEAEQQGLTDVLIQDIYRDGTLLGYRTDLIKTAVEATNLNIIWAGGARREQHVWEAETLGVTPGAGSLVCYRGASNLKNKSVKVEIPKRLRRERK